MKCYLWRSHGRILLTRLIFVLVGRRVVSGICMLKHKSL